MDANAILAPSRGMQQMGVPMERGDNDEADRCGARMKGADDE